jgi:hypothetical protein
MPETSTLERVCPYLRNQGEGQIVLTPADGNYCLLASSIHLPRAQQTRYCLGGRFRQCSRYQRQDNRPIPRYVRGARPMHVRPAAPTVRLRTLPWRYPWVVPALKWLFIVALLLLFIQLWRWRMAATAPFVVKRDPIPISILTPTPETPERYLRPTLGPPPW